MPGLPCTDLPCVNWYGSTRLLSAPTVAVYGDCFQWHVDADPLALPPDARWSAVYDAYTNGAPEKPLFVSLLVYADEVWDSEWDAETLFLEQSKGVGLLVQPRPGRAVLLHQDILHRVSTPSLLANRPRFSLVWKLCFVPKRGERQGDSSGSHSQADRRETICRPELWGDPICL